MTHASYFCFFSSNRATECKLWDGAGPGKLDPVKDIFNAEEWKKLNLGIFGMQAPRGYPDPKGEKYMEHLRNALASGKAVRSLINKVKEDLPYPPIAIVASKAHKTKLNATFDAGYFGTENAKNAKEGGGRGVEEKTKPLLKSNLHLLQWELDDGDNRVLFHNAMPPRGVPVAAVVPTTHAHGELTSDLKAMTQALIAIYQESGKRDADLKNKDGVASDEKAADDTDPSHAASAQRPDDDDGDNSKTLVPQALQDAWLSMQIAENGDRAKSTEKAGWRCLIC
mmetsp:Transcript_9671/g.15605  ORF Transcript_9671/g.15605 Transcript_9671/m.15605 type:complete len:282 (-) Transcript_9671:55-900(-)